MMSSHPTKVMRLGATHRGTHLTTHYQYGVNALSSQVYSHDLYLYCLSSASPDSVMNPTILVYKTINSYDPFYHLITRDRINPHAFDVDLLTAYNLSQF